MTHETDIRVEDEGTIVMLRPLNAEAHDWLEEHVDPSAQWWSGALVVEHRYAEDIIHGAHEAGLVVV